MNESLSGPQHQQAREWKAKPNMLGMPFVNDTLQPNFTP